MKLFSRILDKSVFRRIPRAAAMDTLLAMLFHRAAATIYMLYTAWGIIGAVVGIVTTSDLLGLLVREPE